MKRLHTVIALILLLQVFPVSAAGKKAASQCDDCQARYAIKTNAIHDLALTPDLGVEVTVAKRFSLSLSGMYAWWSRDSSHFYWRIRGGYLEMRYWFGYQPRERALTGHHIGIYGSIHDYDFEFGGKGWQSPDNTYGAGLAYGFAIPLASRLNIDFGIKAGYSAGNLIKYRPECGEYVRTSSSFRRYFGITGLEVSLVWFPGRNKKNNPVYNL